MHKSLTCFSCNHVANHSSRIVKKSIFFILCSIFLFACEKQELRYSDNLVDYSPSAEELSEINAIVESEFKTEPWNDTIDTSYFSRDTHPGYWDQREVIFNYAPIHSTDKARHFISVQCEKDAVKKENWSCEKESLRSIYYPRDNSWVVVGGNVFSDKQWAQFLEKIAAMEELPVFTGRNLLMKNVEFIYFQEAEDKSIFAEIFDREKGASLVYFSSEIDAAPSVMHVSELSYDCIDQNYRSVSSRFPCDYKKEE